MATQTISKYDKGELSRILARTRLWDFVKYNHDGYDGKWFHKLICDEVQCLLTGSTERLMIFVPPQHGKSEIVSRMFPAFAFGKNPDLRIATCCYSSDLSQSLNRHCQRIMDNERYLSLFPKTTLSGRNIINDAKGAYIRTSDNFEIVNHSGGLKSVGVGGPLTGNRVDIGIIDDPVKDVVEASSSTYRARLWEWYTDVFCTRLHNSSRQLLTMTRWHEDDLAGRILKAEGHRWRVVSLPYIFDGARIPYHCITGIDHRDIGDALWPDRHSAQKGIDTKAKSERTYASLLQQRPAPAEGGMFKECWFKRPLFLPLHYDKTIISIDCAFKETDKSDYFCAGVMGKIGANTYLMDVDRGRYDFPTSVRRVESLHYQYPGAAIYIEEKANGAAIIQTLRDRIPGIIAINPTESKESRAAAVSYVVESGNYYVPANATWAPDYIQELISFPNGSNDDQVDMTSQGLNKLYNCTGTTGAKVRW
jgi:predicted phage terminase large subunit-like protein